MVDNTTKGRKIRAFILSNVEKHPTDIASQTAKQFGITRQAVNQHLKKLVVLKALTPDGKNRGRSYRLASVVDAQVRNSGGDM